MELKRKIKMMLIVCMLFCTSTFAYAETEHKIEQVFINMPDVTAYYRSPDAQNEIDAYLGGENLQLESNQLFAETTEGVEYYVLLDISASIRNSRFDDIKAALTQFNNSIRENDKLILITFGDEVTTVLDGTLKGAGADEVIAQIQNKDQNTLFFEAIDYVADVIRNAASEETLRRVAIVISDGKDCSDNTRSMESVENSLRDNGIPIYTIAVENNEGDSETEISSYQGKFSALARNTGGIPWTVTTEHPQTWEAFENIQKLILESYRAQFRASSNKITNKTEEFVMKFLSAGDTTDSYNVLVARNQKDETNPSVAVSAGDEYNELKVVYSEAVENAESIGNYIVKLNDKKVPVKQITKNADEAYSYSLVFDDDLAGGEYVIEISDIVDASNEKNTLSNEKNNLTLDGPSVEANNYQMLPIIVVAGILFIIIIVTTIVLSGKKRKAEKQRQQDLKNKTEGNRIESSDRNVIALASKRNNSSVRVIPEADQGKKVNIWMSSGHAEPKKIEYKIYGSVIVGRSSTSDIECADPHMSRQHFALEVEGDTIYVRDLETQNGTCVNGIKINGRYKLNPTDEISAGNVRFIIEW